MTKRIFSILLISLLTAFCNILPAEALFIREYTEDRPLIIVCDWEFPPYEYRNDKGDADGYNVTVLHTILSKLKIPHRFVSVLDGVYIPEQNKLRLPYSVFLSCLSEAFKTKAETFP